VISRIFNTIAAFGLALGLVVGLPAVKAQADEIGGFTNDWSGNRIIVEAIADPKIQGVTCHITRFDRSVFDRLSKGKWFEDPSNTSIACRADRAVDNRADNSVRPRRRYFCRTHEPDLQTYCRAPDF